MWGVLRYVAVAIAFDDDAVLQDVWRQLVLVLCVITSFRRLTSVLNVFSVYAVVFIFSSGQTAVKLSGAEAADQAQCAGIWRSNELTIFHWYIKLSCGYYKRQLISIIFWHVVYRVNLQCHSDLDATSPTYCCYTTLGKIQCLHLSAIQCATSTVCMPNDRATAVQNFKVHSCRLTASQPWS